ncbi:MAG: 50S ribosomal protein L31 [Malacoplasma sp.]
MKKNVHPTLNDVQFVCASCNSSFLIKSTLENKKQNIDVCSNCHPFYVGTFAGHQAKGRAEQFNKKISKVAETLSKTEASKTKKVLVEKKQNKKIVKSLNNL